MISIREQSYGLNVALYNEFTIEDFRMLEDAIIAAGEHVHRPDLLLDLSMLRDFTIDEAVEQLHFFHHHEDDFGRIAIVVDDIWLKLGAHISSLLTLQHPKYFDDAASAQKWLLANIDEDDESKTAQS